MTFEPLSGVRVVEAGSSIASAYAGKLLSDLGADVEKLEQVARSVDPAPEQVQAYWSTLYGFLDYGKTSVNATSGRLTSGDYDLLITDQSLAALRARELDPAALAADSKIVLAVTNFGLNEDGPEELLPDMLMSALGGFVLLTGLADRAPTINGASLPQFQAGMVGVVGALGALLGRDSDGLGEVVDVSLYEAVTFFFEREDVLYTHQNALWQRSGRHKLVHPFAILPCKDGYVALCTAAPLQFRALAELIEHPELADSDEKLLQTSRIQNADLIDTFLLPWLAEHDREEVARLCQERRIPTTPVLDFEELLTDANSLHRQFFETRAIDNVVREVPGLPYRFHEVPTR